MTDNWIQKKISVQPFYFLSSRAWQVRYQSKLINELRKYFPDIKPMIISREKWTGGNASSEAKSLMIPYVVLPRPSKSNFPFWSGKNPAKEISSALDILKKSILDLFEMNQKPAILFLDRDDDYLSNYIIYLFKSKSFKVILYQHGYEIINELSKHPFYLGKYIKIKRYIRHITFFGFLPIQPKGVGKNGSDLNLVFSESSLLAYKKYGIKESSLKCIGNMSLDHLSNKNQKYLISKNNKILLCTPGFYRLKDVSLHRLTTHFIENIVEKWGNDVKIVIRLKPGELPVASKELHDLLLNERIGFPSIDDPVVEIGKDYDFVVSYSSSNVALECLIAKIPVAIYRIHQYKKYMYLSGVYKSLKIPEVFSKNAGVVPLDNIYNQLESPPKLNESLISNLGSLEGNSCMRAAKEINNYISMAFP